MMTFLLSARRVVTESWREAFRWSDELSLSLTGHLEEVFVGNDENGAIYEVREVPRFGLRRHAVTVPRRVLCRRGGRRGAVRELVWAL